MKRIVFYSILAIEMIASSLFISCTNDDEPYSDSSTTTTDEASLLKVSFIPILNGSIFDYVDMDSLIVTINGVDTTIVYNVNNYDNESYPVTDLSLKKLPADISYRIKYTLREDAKPKSDNKYSVYNKMWCRYIIKASTTAPYCVGDSYSVFHENDYILGDKITAWVDSCNNSATQGHFKVDENGKFTELSPKPNPNNIKFKNIQRANVRAEVFFSGSLFDFVETEMVCKSGDDEEFVIPCKSSITRWINDLDAFHFPARFAYKIRYKIKPDADIVEDQVYTWQVYHAWGIDYTYINRFHATGGFSSSSMYYSPTKGSDIPKWVDKQNASEQYYKVSLNEEGEWSK